MKEITVRGKQHEWAIPIPDRMYASGILAAIKAAIGGPDA